jgi:ribose/xylose/arabinose/galactoside ABC-type transport system permease subunit
MGAMTASPSSRTTNRLYAVPFAWEGLLLVGAVIAVAIVFLGGRHPTVNVFLAALAPIGLIAAAASLSLRTATPNLAVGALAIVAAAIGVSLTNHGTPLAAAMAVGIVAAAVAGLVLGVITAALSVPAWLVTLGGGAIVEAAVLGSTDAQILVLRTGTEPPSVLWFALFVVVTLGGGALWLVPGVCTTLSATRDAPAGPWAGWRAGLGAIAGLAGSGLVAGLAGVAYALRLHSSLVPSGAQTTLLGFAIALLGGISVFGRIGGVAGVLLATVLVGSVQQILALRAAPSWVLYLVTGLVLLIGLGVSRLIESVGAGAAPSPPPPPG